VARDLPRGPHSLSRDEVAESQRRRLVTAMIDEVGSAGYAQTTVTDVIRRAGVSRKAFYEHFDNREACLLAAYDRVIATSLQDLVETCRSAPAGDDALESALDGMVEQAIRQPAMMRLVLTELGSVAPQGATRRERHIASYEEILRLATGMRSATGLDPLLRAIVGGIAEVLRTRLGSRRQTQLKRLVAPLAAWVELYRAAPPALSRPLHELETDSITASVIGGSLPGSLSPHVVGGARGLRGDHTSSRNFIVHNQRERILDAVALQAARKGYAAVTVRDISESARVSLDAFYEHFIGKEDAFLCAYEVGHTRILVAVENANRTAVDWVSGVRAGIRTLVEFLVSEPIFARMALLEAPTASPQTAARARQGFIRYTQLLAPGPEQAANAGPAAKIATEAIGGGLFELLLTYTVQRRLEDPADLIECANVFALAPFVGVEEASGVRSPNGSTGLSRAGATAPRVMRSRERSGSSAT
jgi:AcrR family transcriptional regulator